MPRLLKPINNEKLRKGLERAKKGCLLKNETTVTPEMWKELLGNYQFNDYKKRFICKVGNKVIFKQAEEIAYFFVENIITFIQGASTGKKFMVSHSLEELEQQHLDLSKIYRINRSTIINWEHFIEMKKCNNGRLKLSTRPNENLDLIVAGDRVSDLKN